MNILEEREIQCPYCGEEITILIDCSEREQTYIEDCQVCCRPINLDISVAHDDTLSVRVTHENE